MIFGETSSSCRPVQCIVWCKYLFQLLVVEVQIHEHPAEKVLLWVLIQGHDHIGIEFGENMLLRFFVFVDRFKIPLLAFIIVGFVHGIMCAN